MDAYKMRERHAFVDVLEDHHYFRIYDYYVITLFVMTLFMMVDTFMETFMVDVDNHVIWEVAEYDSDEESDEEYDSEEESDEEYESDSFSILLVTVRNRSNG